MSKQNGKKPRSKTDVLRDKNGRWLKGTPPPNPAGRPAANDSWGEVFAKVGKLSPVMAAKWCKEIAEELGKIKSDVTLKEAVVLRVYAALMFEPSGSLLEKVMDRAEGKLPQGTFHDWRAEAEAAGLPPDMLNEIQTEFNAIIERALDRVGAGRVVPDGTQTASDEPGV